MKKTLKRILATFLTVIMLFSALPLAGIDFTPKASALASSGQCGKNVYWNYESSTGTLIISGTGKMYDYLWGDSPFSDEYLVKSVIMKKGIESIGMYAFYYCHSLTNITIPDSVTSIGDSAFKYCNSLTSVTIGNGVTSIGDSAFEDCHSLTNITIPDSVTTIDEDAFYNCFRLTSITIGNGVTSIGKNAFNNCDSLTSITIPDSVTSIGKGAFASCYSLTSITIPDSVTSIGESTFYNCSSLISVTIPDSVTTIGDRAFSYCYNLTSITIPTSVTTIGEDAFASCYSLTSVTIPDSVTTIGESAFSDCYSLTSITIPDSVTSIGDGAFFSCSRLTSITIPTSVTTIGDSAFKYCNSLTSVTIPTSVTTIGDSAFEDCLSLTSITIPTSVTTIGDSAFASCLSLTSITIGNGVTSIGVSAFYYCYYLTSITIPDSVTSIGKYAFCDCDNLTDVYYNGTEEQWNKINIGEENERLTNATIHYNYVIDTPTIPDTPSLTNYITGTFESYVPYVFLDENDSYIGSVKINGTDYTVKKDLIKTMAEAECYVNKYVTAYFQNGEIYSLQITETQTQPSANWYDNSSSIFYGASSLNSTRNAQILEAKQIFFNAVEKYIAAIGTEAGDYIIDIDSMVKELKKNGESYFSLSTDTPKDATDSAYYALAKFIIEVAEKNSLCIKVNPKDYAFEQAISIVQQVTNSIYPTEKTYYYGNYKVDLSVLLAGQAYYGDIKIEKYKGSNKGKVYSGLIVRDTKRTKEVMAAYMNSLGDVVYDECKYALASIYSEIMSLTGLTQASEEYLNNLFEEKTEILYKKGYGKILENFVKIKKAYSILFQIGDLSNLDNGGFGTTEKLEKIYKELKDFDFSKEKVKKSTIKSAVNLVQKAKNDLVDKLYDRLYGVDSGDPDNKTAFDKTKSFLKETWNCLVEQCPVEFEVYDSKGNLIGYVDSSENHDEYIYFTDDIYIDVVDDVKYIYYPANMKITIKLLAIDDGQMNYSIEQFNKGVPTGKMNFADVPLTCGETYEQTIPANANLKNSVNTLTLKSTETTEKGIYYNASNDNHIEVTSLSSKGGYAIGAGEYSIGSNVKMFAFTDSDKNEFIGWFVNGNCVSTNRIYQFTAKEDIQVIALFGNVPVLSINNIEVNYKDTTRIVPQIKADNGVKYTVKYESSNPSVATIDKDGNITTHHKGETKVTCTVTDEYGNVVKDTCTVTVKFSFGQWLIWILLFGFLWY